MSKNTSKKLGIIREEYGFRFWVFLIEQNEVESLVQWWENLDSVMGMFFDPRPMFPIDLIEMTEENEDQYELNKDTVAVLIDLHEDSDSTLKIIGGETYKHAGYVTYSSEEADLEEDEELEPLTEAELVEIKTRHPEVYKMLTRGQNEI